MKCNTTFDPKINNSEFLNKECVCGELIPQSPYKNFSSHSPVFLSRKVVKNIEACVAVLEKTIESQTFKNIVSTENYSNFDDIHGGILKSYDFHLAGETPKLIEINTNAGGFFINYELAKTSPHCCQSTTSQDVVHLEEKVIRMFKNEFAKEGTSKELKTVAIIDDNPDTQFLYPDFTICKDILEKNGITTLLVDTDNVSVDESQASVNEVPVDLIYNRLTDFYFREEKNKKYLPLLKKGRTVISPNTLDYVLFANKMNLFHLQEYESFVGILSPEEIKVLRETMPEVILVGEDNAKRLWENRKKYFFKPLNSYGGKGAYNGKGLTKKVWENILTTGYIAQETIAPTTKVKDMDGEREEFKFDIRAYMYQGEILLLGAREYQGQTTNFRTEGGGFASVFITEN